MLFSQYTQHACNYVFLPFLSSKKLIQYNNFHRFYFLIYMYNTFLEASRPRRDVIDHSTNPARHLEPIVPPWRDDLLLLSSFWSQRRDLVTGQNLLILPSTPPRSQAAPAFESSRVSKSFTAWGKPQSVKSGASEGIRTPDRHFTKVLLYH